MRTTVGRLHPLRLLPLITLLAVGGLAQAQERHDRRGGGGPGGHDGPGRVEARGPARGGPGLVLDQRFHHDHWYPPRGYVVPALPGGAIGISFAGGSWYFHGGVWFRPLGGRFSVVLPPVGIVVPVLPPAYVTLWIAGAPFYYANGVYYQAAPGQGYAVVAPPPDADTAKPAPVAGTAPAAAAKPPPEPVIYPRNGQSAEQTEADRQECNRWATTQPRAVADAEVFQRAVAACMDGRGYSLR